MKSSTSKGFFVLLHGWPLKANTIEGRFFSKDRHRRVVIAKLTRGMKREMKQQESMP